MTEITTPIPGPIKPPWPLGKHNKELYVVIGLPYSGKSTWARKFGAPIVSPDMVRIALHGHRFYSDAEDLIWAIAKIMVRSLFATGYDKVVVDATHTTKKRRDFWKDANWRRIYVVVDVSPDVCRKRAQKAEDADILPIIDRMEEQLEFDGVIYGDPKRRDAPATVVVDDEDAVPPIDMSMASHIRNPGEDEPQIYHIGSAGD